MSLPSTYVVKLLALAVPLALLCFTSTRRRRRVGGGAADLTDLSGPSSLSWITGYLTPYEASPPQLGAAAARAGTHYGHTYFARGMASRPTMITADAAVVRHVLHSRASEHFVRSPVMVRTLRNFIGPGLAISTGDIHRRYRRVAMPAFASSNMDANADDVLAIGERLVSALHAQLDGGADYSEVDMHQVFGKATLDAMGLVGFRLDFGALREAGDDEGKSAAAIELKASLDAQLRLVANPSRYTMLRLVVPRLDKVGNWLGLSQERALRRLKSSIDGIASRLVDDAKRADVQGKDLLSQLVRSNVSSDTKPSERIDDAGMTAMVPDFLVAALDTTNASLCWAVYSLSRGPQQFAMQQRLRAELNDTPGWRQDWHVLDRLPFLDAVLKETMRVHAPVPVIERLCDDAQGDSVSLSRPASGRDGTPVHRVYLQRGDAVQMRIRDINVDEYYWGADAKHFRPERWLDGSIKEGAGIGWNGLLTFSVGAKSCIGYRLAVMQFKVFLAHFVANFDTQPTADTVHEYPFVFNKPRVLDKGICLPILVRPLNVT